MRAEVRRGSVMEGHRASGGVRLYVKGDGGSTEGFSGGRTRMLLEVVNSPPLEATKNKLDDGG